MPPDMLLSEFHYSISWIQYKPKKILDEKKQNNERDDP
jgi:hypothetical protein